MLRLETYPKDSEHTSLLQMQALNLQLTYDNLQIVLHRTIAFQHGIERLGAGQAHIDNSMQQLLASAMKTSELYQNLSVLHASRRTHADMHIGISLFTAGVVLCAMCLANPMTELSAKAKMGIMHIIAMCRDATSTSPHLISSQSLSILESLVKAILQREDALITGRGQPASPARPESGEARTHPRVETSGGTAAAELERPLRPVQEGKKHEHIRLLDMKLTALLLNLVFAYHTSRSTSWPDTGVSGSIQTEQAAGPSSQSAAEAPIFVWDGDSSFLVDSGLAEASQLWLWADDLSYDSFNDPAYGRTSPAE